MKNVLWLLKWVLKAAVFFTLFAFALNNQQAVTLHFFFGNQWSAPLVLVVLIVFTAGVVVGVVGMVPWHFKPKAPAAQTAPAHAATASTDATTRTPAAQPAYSDGL